MKVEKKRAIEHNVNSFNQGIVTDLGFDKEYFTLSKAEFESDNILPNAQGYGVIADDYTRQFVDFKEWEEPTDCKYIVFDVVNGHKCNFTDVERDLYNSSLRFVKIEK